MAKRRRLEMPNLSETLEAGQGVSPRNDAEKPSLGPMSAPISKVVAETAEAQNREAQEARVKAAAYARDAEALQAAEREGRLISALPISAIEAGYLQRDRQIVGVEELEELKRSILENGLRMPIEVVKTGVENGKERYGLIAGLRRLSAVRLLATETLDPQWETIKVIVRPRESAHKEYVAMVEENEMRADLTYFERGRIVDLSTDLGVFDDVDSALAALFSQASKSKRSKIRSFAAIHRELGEQLNYAHALGERNGLKLAGAIRDGKTNRIRKALLEHAPQNADEEWAVIEAAMLDRASKAPKTKTKIGRTLEVGYSGKPGKFKLEFSGRDANDELKDAVMEFLRQRLG